INKGVKTTGRRTFEASKRWLFEIAKEDPRMRWRRLIFIASRIQMRSSDRDVGDEESRPITSISWHNIVVLRRLMRHSDNLRGLRFSEVGYLIELPAIGRMCISRRCTNNHTKERSSTIPVHYGITYCNGMLILESSNPKTRC